MTEKEDKIFEVVGSAVAALMKAIAETMVVDKTSSIKLVEAKDLVYEVFDKYYKMAKGELHD